MFVITREQNDTTYWSKVTKQFLVNSCRKFICQFQASKRGDKQVLGLEFYSLRILDTFQSFKLSY